MCKIDKTQCISCSFEKKKSNMVDWALLLGYNR